MPVIDFEEKFRAFLEKLAKLHSGDIFGFRYLIMPVIYEVLVRFRVAAHRLDQNGGEYCSPCRFSITYEASILVQRS